MPQTKQPTALHNFTYKVNNADIRQEVRDGRDYWVVPAKTMPSDCIMNGILYPKREIEDSYYSLDRTPAPNGHPQYNGEYVSAKSPEGLIDGWIGAFNENVRLVNEEEGKSRVYLDVAIDVATAKQNKKGKEVLKALESGEPMHTSVGVYCYIDEPDRENEEYIGVAKYLWFDHNALLPNDIGASTPEDGTGIFVNKEGEKLSLVVNNFTSDNEKHLTKTEKGYKEKNTQENSEANMSEKDDKEITTSAEGEVKVTGNSETPTVTVDYDKIKSMISEAIAENEASKQEAKANEDKDDLVTKVVATNLLDKETAETLSVSVLEKLVSNNKPAEADVVDATKVEEEVENFDFLSPNKNISQGEKE